MNIKPNLFVVGAPKAGTTALYNILVQHKEIYCAREKELHFFSQLYMTNNYYNTKTISSVEAYLSNYKNAKGRRYIGDFSPSYMYYPQALEAIKKFNPDSKIIIALRHPAQRALSHYLMDVSKGFQKHSLAEILNNPDTYPEYFYQYITLSRYSLFIRSCINTFGRRNVLLLFSENMRQCPTSEFGKLFSFLQLEDTDEIKLDIESNQGFAPRFRFLQNARANRFTSYIFQSIPYGLRVHIKGLLTSSGSVKRDNSGEILHLEEILKEEIVSFSHAIENDERNNY